ncbi:MAG TPA: S53 family peptidase [Candidatus Baltobacterales bacterium]|nr:S53 family peptidase [Candidatus Baltobacterales bacterium]
MTAVAAALVAPAVGVGMGALSASAATLNSTPISYQANPPAKFGFPAGKTTAFPTPSQCVAAVGLACYTPDEIRAGYDVPAADTGAGQTIVIVDAYGSPTVRQDLQVFDGKFGLPDPTLNIIYPGGAPVYNPLQHNSEIGWAEETSLDTQWAHSIAPAATIDLVIAANNLGNVLNKAEEYAVSHHLGNVMSMSFGAPEGEIKGGGNNLQLAQAHAIYQQAAQEGISVFASSGDSGATNGCVVPPPGPSQCYKAPNASYPASDPYVTAVGGTDLFLTDPVLPDVPSKYQSEWVWNDSVASQCPFGCTYGTFGATGGAPSLIFAAPSYQAGVTGKSMRTTSDVAYNASVYTAVMVYLGFLGGANNGFYFFGGTSEGAPQWAAIAALADAQAGHALGFLNPTLYAIGANSSEYASDFHDITVGNNGLNGYPGFSASTQQGYDLPTGWGSPDVANLITTLAS